MAPLGAKLRLLIGRYNISIIFHAGTREKDGEVLTAGGRVLAITSLANDFKEALKKSYSRIEKISFENMYYRKDIGMDL